jgi:putative acetyltransferase
MSIIGRRVALSEAGWRLSWHFRSLSAVPYLLAVPHCAQIEEMIEVRDECPLDWEAVYEAVSSAFGQLAEAELVKALREAGDSVLSLVAEEDGQIVGHILLSRMEAPFPALALAPVSVIPARQRSDIGSALVKGAVNRACSEGWEAIFVLGDPEYYERFGFDREAATGFTSPYAGTHFMVLELSPPLSARTGELHHAPAFAALN